MPTSQIYTWRSQTSRHKADLITFQFLHNPIDKNAFLKIKQALLDEKLDLITSLCKHEIEDIEVRLSLADLNMEALD